MSASMRASENTRLLTFLVWNAFNNGKLKSAYQQFSAYWQASFERYQMWISNSSRLPMHLPSFAIKHASIIGDVFGGVIVIVLGSSLFGVVANFTTGITVAHTGFTPNVNVTASIGFVPIIQLIPFLFGAMILLMVYAIFEKHLPGGL